VTICVAAISNSGHIITATDTQLTAGGYYSTPMGSLKTYILRKNWRVLIAGKIAQKTPILEQIQSSLRSQQSLTTAQVAKACTDAFVQATRQATEEKILSRYGLTMDTFLRSRKVLGEVYRELWGEITRIQIGIDMLVFGFDEIAAPTIFVVSNPSEENPSFITYCDETGFGCIGTGAFLAESTLYGFEHGLGGSNTLADTIYHVACAKFAAEAASDVGELTYLRAYKSNGEVLKFTLMWTEQKLRSLWVKYGKPKDDKEVEKEILAEIEKSSDAARIEQPETPNHEENSES
jgi:hypothetical protein